MGATYEVTRQRRLVGNEAEGAGEPGVGVGGRNRKAKRKPKNLPIFLDAAALPLAWEPCVTQQSSSLSYGVSVLGYQKASPTTETVDSSSYNRPVDETRRLLSAWSGTASGKGNADQATSSAQIRRTNSSMASPTHSPFPSPRKTQDQSARTPVHIPAR